MCSYNKNGVVEASESELIDIVVVVFVCVCGMII
jgi:hypothetical protein